MAPRMAKRLRRLSFGLSTLLGFGARGFFIPHRYASTIARPLPANPAIERLFADHAATFADLLGRLDRYREALTAIGADAPPEPRWGQGWFPRLDAAIAYALVRERMPARIIEVGSGHSTRFLARAVRDGGLETVITAIDPEPRRSLAGLPVVHLAHPLQQVQADLFGTLEPGDILFIDSSHIVMPGTDLDVLFGQILAALPAGVLVHVHDIFLPDDYPRDWIWRGYNEQQAVAALLAGGGVRPLFACRYAATRMSEMVAGTVVGQLPIAEGVYETSLWLEKITSPLFTF